MLPSRICLYATHDRITALRAEHVGAVVLTDCGAQSALASRRGGELSSARDASVGHYLRAVDDKMRDGMSITF